MENTIRKDLQKFLPEAGFFVEEGTSEKKDLYNWVIDPIDGTKNYVNNLPMFLTQVALLYKDIPVLGVVYKPVSKQLFSTVTGNGAYLNRTKIEVSPRTTFEEAILDLDFGGNDDEIEWREKSDKHTDAELLQIFSELKDDIIPEKLTELQEEKQLLKNEIREWVRFCKYKIRNEDYWFCQTWIKATFEREFETNNKQIASFEKLRYLASERKDQRSHLTEVHIDHALQVPIERIFSQAVQLRKSGRNFIILCPFHNERTGSFYIFTNKNRYYCFGACKEGGNVINLVQKLHGFSFQEAINYLTQI